MSELTINTTDDSVFKVLKSANTENPSVDDMKALAVVFDENPQIWKGLSNLSAQATTQISKAMGGTALRSEGINRSIEDMRQQLGGVNPTPIESMLIDQVLVSYLDFYWIQHVHTSTMRSNPSVSAASFLEKRLSGAQRRYTRALTSLAKVQKMGLSGPMQINIAENQSVYNTLLQFAADRLSEGIEDA